MVKKRWNVPTIVISNLKYYLFIPEARKKTSGSLCFDEKIPSYMTSVYESRFGAKISR